MISPYLSNESFRVEGRAGAGGGDSVVADRRHSVGVGVAAARGGRVGLSKSLLLVSGGGESHGSSFIVDSDQSSSGVNIGVAAGHMVSISGLILKC